MLATSLEVVIDRTRRDAFALVSSLVAENCLANVSRGTRADEVVPLELTVGSQPMYVGCLLHKPHNRKPYQIVLSGTLARDFGIEEGTTVVCNPVWNAPRATRVFVAPTTVDESEVVECSALHIEATLLRQVQVVSVGMPVSVVVRSGVSAKVKVERVEVVGGAQLGAGRGCAVMSDGTEFIVATRVRSSPPDDADSAGGRGATPRWAVLRTVPAAEVGSAPKGVDTSAIVVSQSTAEQYGWTAASEVGVVDLGALARDRVATHPTAAPTMDAIRDTNLRRHACRASLVVVPHGPDGWDLPRGKCWNVLAAAISPSNLLLFPHPERNITHTMEHLVGAPPRKAHGGSVLDCGRDPPGGPLPEGGGPGDAPAGSEVELRALVEVHGSVVLELASHLATCLSLRGLLFDASTPSGPHNVLLCGARGYGKSAIALAAARSVRGAHVVHVECRSSPSFLEGLRGSLAECVAHAPSVLILDNLDAIAPAQGAGHVAAMSDVSESVVEGVLRRFAEVDGVCPSGGRREPVVVVATCAARDALHESLNTAACFAKVLQVGGLSRDARAALVKQLLPDVSPATADRVAGLLDNYTPFDIHRVVSRVVRRGREPGAGGVDGPLVADVKEVLAHFVPLAHTGIHFLRGAGPPRAWDDVGGLGEAKRVLRDTLLLPMRHPRLFAKLPLKTRSGVMLYGPSGCGKSYVVETAVSAEGLSCIVVNGPEVFGKYIGESEQKIRDVFRRAQAAAPCVVFFDEFDSIAPQRGVDNTGVTDRVVNQLLCYLDGVEARKDVYVVAASSRPDLVDAALLRPGRFDKLVHCGVPSQEERVEVLRAHLKTARSSLTATDLEHVAARCEGWSPADLAALLATANLLVGKRSIERRREAAAAGSRGVGAGEATAYTVLGRTAAGGTDRLTDALGGLTGAVPRGAAPPPAHAEQAVEDGIRMADIDAAMASMRPSLSARDLALQKRIRRQFTQEPAGTPPRRHDVGTKVTFS